MRPLDSRWVLVAGLVVLALILLAAFPYFEQTRNANELPRLVQAMALVEQGEWAIDGPSRRGLALGPDIARSPVDQRAYPNKPPGASLVGALAYGLAKLGPEPPTLRELTWWARLLAGIVPILILAGVGWRRLANHYDPASASAAIACLILATPLFAYARLFYGHALAACLLYLGVVGIELGLRERRAAVLGLGAIAAAAAIAVEYGAAFAGLPIAVVVLAPLVRGPAEERGAALSRAGLALAMALVPVVLLALYHRHVYGSPWATGYHHAADPGFAELHGQGLLGLGAPRAANLITHWLSPRTGLLVWSPVVLLGLAGLVRLAARPDPFRGAARIQLAVFATIALMGLGLSFEGGWRIGPRYLVVVLPMLGLGVAEIFAWLRGVEHGRVWSALAAGGIAALVGWSLVTNALAASLWPHIDPTNIGEPFGEVLIPLWRAGYGPYGPFPTTLVLALPVVAGLGALAWVVLGSPRASEAAAAGVRRGPLVAGLALVVGAGIGAMVPLVLIPSLGSPHPKSERNLRYIERVYEPVRAPREHQKGQRVAAPSMVLEPLEPT